jgi:hypothetical protein
VDLSPLSSEEILWLSVRPPKTGHVLEINLARNAGGWFLPHLEPALLLCLVPRPHLLKNYLRVEAYQRVVSMKKTPFSSRETVAVPTLTSMLLKSLKAMTTK